MKNLFIALILFVTSVVYAGPVFKDNSGSTINGNFIVLKKPNLDMSGLASVLTSTFDPTLVAFDAPAGSLLLRSNGSAYVKTDAGSTTHWSLLNTGSGNSSAGIAGSIQYSGGSGAFAADAVNLFWDSTNKKLGIGTSTPGTNIYVNSAGASGTDHGITNENNSANNVGGNFAGKKSRGTLASPVALLANDRISSLNGWGYGTGYGSVPDVSIIFTASEAFTGTAHGTAIDFWTTNNTTASERRIAQFTPGGSLGLYDNTGSTQQARLNATASQTMPSGTTAAVSLQALVANQNLGIWTANNGSGNSADLRLETGTATGTRGKIVLQGLRWPNADGTSGQFLQTDGSGNLTFASAGGGGIQPFGVYYQIYNSSNVATDIFGIDLNSEQFTIAVPTVMSSIRRPGGGAVDTIDISNFALRTPDNVIHFDWSSGTIFDDTGVGSLYGSARALSNISGDQVFNWTNLGLGTNGYVLSTDGAGALTWIPAGGGSLPSMTGKANLFLSNDGTNSYWDTSVSTDLSGVGAGQHTGLLLNGGATTKPTKLVLNNDNSGKKWSLVNFDTTHGPFGGGAFALVQEGFGHVFDVDPSTNEPSFSTNILPMGSGNYTLGNAGNVWDELDVYSPTIWAQDNSGAITLATPHLAAGYGLVLPNTQGGANTFLHNDGAGNLDWTTGGGGISWSSPVDADIVPDANLTRSIGSDGANFVSVHTNEVKSNQLLTLTSTYGMNVAPGNPAFTLLGTGSASVVLGFNDATSAFAVSIRAPTTLTQSTSYIWPLTDGSSGDVLSTDGTGQMSWVTPNSSSVGAANVLQMSDGTGGFSATTGVQYTTDFGGGLSGATGAGFAIETDAGPANEILLYPGHGNSNVWVAGGLKLRGNLISESGGNQIGGNTSNGDEITRVNAQNFDVWNGAPHTLNISGGGGGSDGSMTWYGTADWSSAGKTSIYTASGVNTADIDIHTGAASGTRGNVSIQGLSYPTADGTASQCLKTDGAGVLSFGPCVSTASHRTAQVLVATWTPAGGSNILPFTAANIPAGSNWTSGLVGTNQFIALKTGVHRICLNATSDDFAMPVEVAILYGINGGGPSVEMGSTATTSLRAAPSSCILQNLTAGADVEFYGVVNSGGTGNLVSVLASIEEVDVN